MSADPTRLRPTPLDDASLAGALAAEAGVELLRLRSPGADFPHGAHPADTRLLTGRALGDRADRVSHQLLADRLRAARPDDGLRSEEASDRAAGPGASRVWIVDPLDGTKEYGEGRDDWAVHVARWDDGELVGAVAIPGEGLTLTSAEPPALPPPRPGRLRLAVSRSHLSATVAALADDLDAELVPMGSAGVKVAAVVRGLADAYVHTGGQFEWDSAAPVAVARAAGLHTSRVDGTELRYNQGDPWLPDLVVARPEVANRVLAAVSRVLGGVAR